MQGPDFASTGLIPLSELRCWGVERSFSWSCEPQLHTHPSVRAQRPLGISVVPGGLLGCTLAVRLCVLCLSASLFHLLFNKFILNSYSLWKFSLTPKVLIFMPVNVFLKLKHMIKFGRKVLLESILDLAARVILLKHLSGHVTSLWQSPQWAPHFVASMSMTHSFTSSAVTHLSEAFPGHSVPPKHSLAPLSALFSTVTY